MLKDGEYGQLFFMRIDMVGSEKIISNTSPGQYRSMSKAYTELVEQEVRARGGRGGSWQGDGAVAFLGTTGDEDEIMRLGESMARDILDKLFKILPDNRFRIGIASAPARYWNDVDRMIRSPGVVLAARMEDQARELASGSAMLIPSEIYMVLDDSIQPLYTSVGTVLGNQEAYLYVQPGAGHVLTKPETQTVQALSGVAASSKITFFSLLDSNWYFKSKKELYVAFSAQPAALEKSSFKINAHKKWILEHFPSLPMLTPVFMLEEAGFGGFTLYHSESITADKMQLARFYENDVLVFADASLAKLPESVNSFSPESVIPFLEKVIDFTARYYSKCLGYDKRIRAMLHVINASGHARKMRVGSNLKLQPFVYDRDLCAVLDAPSCELNSKQTVKYLYNQIISQSNLDPQVWGLS